VTERIELTLARDSASPAAARAAAREFLDERCPTQLLEDVAIVVSELVTNAVMHTGDVCVLIVHYSSDQIVIEVRDTDVWRRSGVKRSRGAHDLGRGLGAVQTLSDRWGIERTDDGKSVWAEFDLPAPTHRTPMAEQGVTKLTSRTISE
jgi:anti-sigma regulatory factor (Ser/Thr protein kinase)